MEEKLKKWFIKSAVIDFQEWNAIFLWWLYIYIFSYIFQYSFILWILFGFIFGFIASKYNKLWRRYFYFAVCDLHWVRAKTINLKFK